MMGSHLLPVEYSFGTALLLMDTKKLCWIGLFVGSTVGGYLPVVWGGDVFSFAGIFCSLVGGFLGIWAGYRIGQSL